MSTVFFRRLILGGCFQKFMVGTILFSAVIVGLETNSSLMTEFGPLFRVLDSLIISVFVVETIIRILAQERSPIDYFRDGWNVVDFIIVVGCLLPTGGSAITVFRLIRVLRVLRLITALPKLQTIISALLKSIPSMGYVVALLGIHFYIYGVIGTVLFSKNDPVHFGGLSNSFLTLFQTLTLEGWVDIMRIQLYGCAEFGYENFLSQCTSSTPQPILGVVYFISFIVLGTMIILNLLIGVVVNGMAESHLEIEGTAPQSEMKVILEELLVEIRSLKDEISELKRVNNLSGNSESQ